MNLVYIKQRFRSEFLRNVLTLFSGTALAQIIPLIITPVLTRLYKPSDYGVLAVYIAITSLVAVASTLRYDMAILLPFDDHDAIIITLLSMFFVFSISILLMIIILILHTQIISLIENPSIAPWLYTMPLSVFSIGCSSALNYWLNRHKKYRRLTINRITIAIVVSATTLTLGFYRFDYSGLILGILIGQLTTLIMLLSWTWRDLLNGLHSTSWELIRQNAEAYRKFPFFSLPSDFINYLSQQLPALMMSRFFGPTVVGHLSFSQKILGMPSNLLSQSISDVFKQRASSDYNKYGNCKSIFINTFKMLSGLSVIPSLFIFFFAPLIFKTVFGAEWEQAGYYTRYLGALYFTRFIISPLSYIFFITHRQDIDLFGQISLLAITIGSMLFGAYLNNPVIAIILFSSGYSLIYGIYFLIARKLSYGESYILLNDRMSE